MAHASAAASTTGAPLHVATAVPDAGPRTLAIDVGGSHIKASVLDAAGKFLVERVRVPTPIDCSAADVVEAIAKLVEPLPPSDRISVGFPGAVRRGVVLTAPNLDQDDWARFDLAEALTARIGKPTRVLNDADMQGLGAARGDGLEMVITLGTGFGTALLDQGRLLPHLEMAHLRFRKGQSFDEQLGNAARKRVGAKRWNRRVRKAIVLLRTVTNFDHLYIGGGNARHLSPNLPPDVTTIGNEVGIAGGVAAWRD